MAISIGHLSTYPPVECGIATFSYSLVQELIDAGAHVEVVGIANARTANPPVELTHQWVRGEANGLSDALTALNQHDLAIIEHEFGIYPGQDGEDIIRVMNGLRVPALTVLHTVVAEPTFNQRRIISTLLARSSGVIVMTETARQRLIDIYRGDGSQISLIPHGAPNVSKYSSGPKESARDHRPLILTWGLIGPGKGIEWGIAAMAWIKDLNPMPRYHIVGQTHPEILRKEGETYRHELQKLVDRWDLHDTVTFDSRYLRTEELFRIANSADVVLLPYDSAEQVTSGVLVEAVTAGKPVISTAFPHAKELLSSGAGIVVDQKNPLAIAAAIRKVVVDPHLRIRMADEAKRLAYKHLWPNVAHKYLELAEEVLTYPVSRDAVG